MVEVLLAIATAVVGLWAGSMEWRLRNMANKLSDKPSRGEVGNLVDMKLEGQKVLQRELKEDIQEVKRKLDKIADQLSRR